MSINGIASPLPAQKNDTNHSDQNGGPAALLVFMFFISGFASLVLEGIWVRTLALGLGSTSTSLSVVLGIFFFGLAIGGWLSGQYSSRFPDRVGLYGLIEGLIGIYSIFLIYILFHFQGTLAFFSPFNSSIWAFYVLKYLFVLAFLLPPTVLMGASLPVLIGILVRDKRDVGPKISFLYGMNILGGAAGAWSTGFLLIPNLGVVNTNHTAASLNIVIFLSTLWIRNFPFFHSRNDHANYQGHLETKSRASFSYWIPISAGATGLASIAAEVAWNKYLGIFLGSNIYGLSAVLAVFLLGLALGALVLSYVIRFIKDQNRLYTVLLISSAICVLLTSFLLSWSPLFAKIAQKELPWGLSFFFTKIFVATLILLPTATLLGALLPLAISISSEDPRTSPKETGKIYALNTLGSILGSVIAGLFLIPLFGSSTTIQLAVFVLLLAGILSGFYLLVGSARLFSLVAGILIALFVIPLPAIDFRYVLQSAYDQGADDTNSLKETIKNFFSYDEDFKFLYEGRSGIISLSHDPRDGLEKNNILRLKTNGLYESMYREADYDVLPKYEALLGFLPLALARNPENVFVVGYGGGYTVNFLTSSEIQNVTVAELEKGILDAAGFFHAGKNPVLEKNNLAIKLEDARYLLAAGNGPRYDIIVSQPSHSWLAGVANLFTYEFFEIVRDKLNEQGVFSQWLNLYNMDEQVLSSILRTFYSVFPHGAVFTSIDDRELIMIGSKAPLAFDFKKLDSLTKNQTFSRMLAGVPIRTPYQALSHFALTRQEIMRLTEGAQINTDQNAFAETRQSRLFYRSGNGTPNDFLLQSYSGNFDDILQNQPAPKIFLDGLLNAVDGDFRKSRKLVRKLEEIPQENRAQSLSLAKHFLKMERYQSATHILKETIATMPSAEKLNLLLAALQGARDHEEAQVIFKKYSNYGDIVSKCRAFEISISLGDQASAISTLNALLPLGQTLYEKCGAYMNKPMGLYQWLRGNPRASIPYLETYYSYYPNDLRAYRMLAAAYLASGQDEKAKQFAEHLPKMVDTERTRLEQLANLYESDGFHEDAQTLRRNSSLLTSDK